jgi:hypothetical protein
MANEFAVKRVRHEKWQESAPNERHKALNCFVLIPMADERDFIGQKIRASVVRSSEDLLYSS